LKVSKAVGNDNLLSYYLRIAEQIIELLVILCVGFVILHYNNANFQIDENRTSRFLYTNPVKRKLLTNYLPILILTCFTKVIENLIYNRLFNFFDKHALITKLQYGFLKDLSTVDAALDIVTNAYENMNNNEYTGLLEHYDVRGIANELMASYLSNKKQFISNSEIKTDMKIV